MVDYRLKKLIDYDQVRFRFYFSSLTGTSTAIIDNIRLIKEVNGWNMHPNNHGEFVGDNGRMLLSSLNANHGGRTNAISINKLGKLHTMYFDAEIVSLGGTSGVLVKVEESTNGTSNWATIGTQTFNTTASSNAYQIDFTPTKGYIRLSISTGTIPRFNNRKYISIILELAKELLKK